MSGQAQIAFLPQMTIVIGRKNRRLSRRSLGVIDCNVLQPITSMATLFDMLPALKGEDSRLSRFLVHSREAPTGFTSPVPLGRPSLALDMLTHLALTGKALISPALNAEALRAWG